MAKERVAALFQELRKNLKNEFPYLFMLRLIVLLRIAFINFTIKEMFRIIFLIPFLEEFAKRKAESTHQDKYKR